MVESSTSASTSVSPREVVLRAAEAKTPRPEPSLLERLFRWLEESPGWRVSFSDLSGLAQCIPDLRLPVDYQLHSCAFCAHAKSREVSWRDCVRNKHAVNRRLIQRGEGFAGLCHLGVADILEPLKVKGKVLGVFYLGSVRLEGTQDAVQAQIHRYCRRRDFQPEPFLQEWERLPEFSASTLDNQRQRLRLVAEIASRLVESWGFPTGREKLGLAGRIWESDRTIPAMLHRAMKYVQTAYEEDLTLQRVAHEVRVTPDYLGGLFRKHLACTLSEYLFRVRVDHARRLLETGRYSVGEIAVRIGFKDQAHFGKVFKRLTSYSPKRYALLHQQA